MESCKNIFTYNHKIISQCSFQNWLINKMDELHSVSGFEYVWKTGEIFQGREIWHSHTDSETSSVCHSDCSPTLPQALTEVGRDERRHDQGFMSAEGIVGCQWWTEALLWFRQWLAVVPLVHMMLSLLHTAVLGVISRGSFLVWCQQHHHFKAV